MTNTNNTVANPSTSTSILNRMAEKFRVDPNKLWATLSKTCFKPDASGIPFTNEEVMYVLMVAEGLELNPLRREIWAFRGKAGAVQPIVSIDGWKTIMLRHPTFDGYEIRYSEEQIEVKPGLMVPVWCECTIWQKNISHPTVERVFTDEVFISGSPVWNKYPRRMLHHRALIQAIRFSFPVTGISDVGVTDDGVIEGDDIINGYSEYASPSPAPQRQARPVKAVSFDRAKLDAVAAKAIAMARARNDYAPAIKFAERLAGDGRDYVLDLIEKARSADQLQAIARIEADSAEPASEVQDAEVAAAAQVATAATAV